MILNKRKCIEKSLSLLAYLCLGYGIYIGATVFLSGFTWWYYYEPSGMQGLAIVIVGLPLFLVAGILFSITRKVFKTSIIPVIFAWSCCLAVLPVLMIIGAVLCLFGPVLLPLIFIWDFCELRTKPKKFTWLVIAIVVLIALSVVFFWGGISHQAKINIMHNTQVKSTTVKQ